MAYNKLRPLLFALLVQDAIAATITSTATTTPAPVVKRAVTTIGYISVGVRGGTTQWDTITANDQNQVIATSGDLYKICNPTSVCEFFSCSNDYAVFATTSIYCGGASSTCSYWELATDINDQSPLTNYWCDDKTETGGVILMTTPEDGSSISPSTRTSISFTSITTRPGSTETSIDTVDVLPPSGTIKTDSKKKKKSTPIGAIAGGVVGGIVLLGAIIFAIVFLLRRRRRNRANNNNINTNAPQVQPQPQVQQQPPPAPVQYYQEQKPVSQQQVQQMPPPQQHAHYDPNAAQAPQFYDPNAHTSYAATHQQGGYAVLPPEKSPAGTNPVQMNPYYADNGPVSPVPQYSPAASPPPVPANINELPTGRM